MFRTLESMFRTLELMLHRIITMHFHLTIISLIIIKDYNTIPLFSKK
jgi:hypothetical protein